MAILASSHYLAKDTVRNLSNVLRKYLKDTNNEIENIICLGTPKVAFDAIGPYTGEILVEHNILLQVYGTTSYPMNLINLNSRLHDIGKDNLNRCTLVVDACLADMELGTITIVDEPTKPGAGLKDTDLSIGNISIKVTVSEKADFTNLLLNSINREEALAMASVIASIIEEVINN